MTPTVHQPLFIVSGASCAGKTTVCELLFQRERDYIVMESDILWDERYNTPSDGYCDYRIRWMNLCAAISQIGMPVVLCGCAMPEQIEPLPQRALFTDVHYLAVVCDDETMLHRATVGRGVTDESWINSSLHFNRWLRENGANHTPSFRIVDTSRLTPEEGAALVDKWIHEKLNEQS